MTFTNEDKIKSFKVERDWVRYHAEGVYLITKKGLISVNLATNEETVLFKCQPNERIYLYLTHTYHCSFLLNFFIDNTRYGTLNLLSGEFHSVNNPKYGVSPYFVLDKDTVLYMSEDQSWHLGLGTKHEKLFEIGRSNGS